MYSSTLSEIYKLSDTAVVGGEYGQNRTILTQKTYDALHGKMLLLVGQISDFCIVAPMDGSSDETAYVVDKSILESYFKHIEYYENTFAEGDIVGIDTEEHYSYGVGCLASFTEDDYQEDGYVYAVITNVSTRPSRDLFGQYYNVDAAEGFNLSMYTVSAVRGNYSVTSMIVSPAQLVRLSDETIENYKAKVQAHISELKEKYKGIVDRLTPEIVITQVNNMQSELRHRNYPTTKDALRFIVDKWWMAKNDAPNGRMSIMDILSRHPKWNPKTFSIEFDADWSREQNVEAIRDFRWWLSEVLDGIDVIQEYPETDDDDYQKHRAVTRAIKRRAGTLIEAYPQLLTDTVCSNLNYYFGNVMEEFNIPKFHEGAKYSKAVNKILSYCPIVYNHPDYNKAFARFSDAVNPLKVKRHTRISLNPMDFLLQSYGNSGWRSCHYIDCYGDDPGCYSAGTISYMLDHSSFVVYTADAGIPDEEVIFSPKISRCMYAFDGYKLLQQRIYPQSSDCSSDVYEENRALVQHVLSECMGLPNMWTVNHNAVDYCSAGDYARNYQDWREQSSDLSSISILKDAEPVSARLVIGAAAYDVCEKGYRLSGSYITETGCSDSGEEYTLEDEESYESSFSQTDGFAECIALLSRLN